MDGLQSSVPHPDDSPGLLLWRVTMAWQARQRAVLRPHDLTHVQFVLLAGLVDLGQPVSQAELARYMGVDAMMTSQVLRVLVSRGLVERHRDEGDARVIRVEATTAGANLANAAIDDVESTDRAFFAPLGTDVVAFAACLDAVLRGELAP